MDEEPPEGCAVHIIDDQSQVSIYIRVCLGEGRLCLWLFFVCALRECDVRLVLARALRALTRANETNGHFVLRRKGQIHVCMLYVCSVCMTNRSYDAKRSRRWRVRR